MYPNLYYVFKDWFNVEIDALAFLNTFGLMVAVAFIAAAYILTLELKRKEKQGLLIAREEMIVVGKSASGSELFINAIIGFIFGYKLLGIFFSKPPDMDPQSFIFSGLGSVAGGIAGAALMAGLKWYEKNKNKLATPEKRSVRIWPHDRVGDIVILALVFGILGAKLFDSVEHWDDFIADPMGMLFSSGGLTFYGGLILASIAIIWYARSKNIRIRHLVDAAAPALMLAYAIGRLGCQISGDGDWGVYNSAYVSDTYGNVREAGPGEYQQKIQENITYFTEGYVSDSLNRKEYVTDRIYASAEAVPHIYFKGPSFLPDWFFAYTYPGNVNKDGIQIPGNFSEHNRVLPQPVYPTPLYEFLLCVLLFMLLWYLRKKNLPPMFIFGLYLSLNGLERFFIEKIRVNKVYHFMGFESTQSELIALGLVFTGILIMVYSRKMA